MNFMETQRGYDFVNYDVPKLTEAIEEMAKAVEELSSKLSAVSKQKEETPEEEYVMKWHNLILNPEDLPKTAGMYLVVRDMGGYLGEPDGVVGMEFYFSEGSQWNCTTPVAKWMELPPIGEMTE